MTVFDLKTGERAVVLKVNIGGAAAARLKALGLAAGTRVEALAFSLFNSGILLGFNAVKLGMRKSLAQKIEVEREGAKN